MENSFTLQIPINKDFSGLFNYPQYLLIIRVITLHLEFS
jgi:hypothetical protein